MYGYKAWTIKDTRWRLEALETWCYRRMFLISWFQKFYNEEVLDRVEMSTDNIKHKQRKLLY